MLVRQNQSDSNPSRSRDFLGAPVQQRSFAFVSFKNITDLSSHGLLASSFRTLFGFATLFDTSYEKRKGFDSGLRLKSFRSGWKNISFREAVVCLNAKKPQSSRNFPEKKKYSAPEGFISSAMLPKLHQFECDKSHGCSYFVSSISQTRNRDKNRGEQRLDE